ncbi:hypothetical protein [Chryseobacterium sp. JK1]|uniref:hypothetical protein n=1 Tax=Chryseobacterium sp. JK1 TaxID=874294 RepID=UPI003D6806AB
MKKLILVVALILIFVLYKYPIFNSIGISYSIIFSGFVVLCFAGAKLYTSDIKDDYESVEKETDKLHQNDGDFRYSGEGFYVKKEFIKWTEIVEVYSFSIPVLHRKQTGIEIITDKKQYEFNDDNTSGIEKLTDKLSENLPDWKLNSTLMVSNNYGLRKVKLYERNVKITIDHLKFS